MVQEDSYSSYGYEADPKDRKSTYKAMETCGYTTSHTSGTTKGPSGSKKSKQQHQQQNGDSWGPIFKNKQHFVDMHLC